MHRRSPEHYMIVNKQTSIRIRQYTLSLNVVDLYLRFEELWRPSCSISRNGSSQETSHTTAKESLHHHAAMTKCQPGSTMSALGNSPTSSSNVVAFLALRASGSPSAACGAMPTFTECRGSMSVRVVPRKSPVSLQDCAPIMMYFDPERSCQLDNPQQH